LFPVWLCLSLKFWAVGPVSHWTINLQKKLLVYFLHAAAADRGWSPAMVRDQVPRWGPSGLQGRWPAPPAPRALGGCALRVFLPSPSPSPCSPQALAAAFRIGRALAGLQEKGTRSAVLLFAAAFHTTAMNQRLVRLSASLVRESCLPFSQECMRLRQTPSRSLLRQGVDFYRQTQTFQSAGLIRPLFCKATRWTVFTLFILYILI